MEWNPISKNISDQSRNITKIIDLDSIWAKNKFIEDPLSTKAALQFDDETVLTIRKVMCKCKDIYEICIIA